jgi:hypothetical protein
MPDRSKSRGLMKCSPWSTRFGVRHGANDPTLKKFTVTKPCRMPRPTHGCSARKEEEYRENGYIMRLTQSVHDHQRAVPQLRWLNAGFSLQMLVMRAKTAEGEVMAGIGKLQSNG